ncbi:PQQ-dependent sugar dehydrogenase [Dyadobacter sp. 676]|uniref:PQQ-dependent sugar dehydrogenase n=1 Tax=Dyadobacter sp. 676 TaxID=3088362 RepID=A0AAU8FHD7_9BACT
MPFFRPICLIAFHFLLLNQPCTAQKTGPEKFEKRIIAKGLSDPWEIIYGPDSHLWVTESKGYRVLRIDPAGGKKSVLLDLNTEKFFPDYDSIDEAADGGKPMPQGGLMGMALHPRLLTGKPFVYLAYVYDFEGKNHSGDGRDPQDQGFHYKTRIVRYHYNRQDNKLERPQTICDSIPGSNDHNGGRLLIAAVNGRDYLFYSIGDMGAGQYQNAARPNYAQTLASYEGKILRFHTEPETGGEWVPADNPFNNEGRSAVWSLGHRNAQGLASMKLGGDEIIFSSEHGPFSDDEINIIKRGGNYGHPLVIGYPDGNYNGLAAGVTAYDSLPGPWNTTYPVIADELTNARKLKNFEPPVKSFFPTPNKTLLAYMDTIRTGQKSPVWPSLAPSGIAAYTSGAIPGWEGSLLLTSLKNGKVVRVRLSADGKAVKGQTDYFHNQVRYRDVAISADGRSVYLVTDRSVVTSGPSGENPEQSAEQGAIIEFTYKK